jgi:dihydrofolate reductase
VLLVHAAGGLGIGGEAIHAWVLEEPRSPVDEAVLAGSFETTGAVVIGRRLYDIVDGPNGWNDDIGYGHDQNQSAAPPCYVVTHEPPAEVRLASRFRFVTEGVAAAIDQARATAGDRDVVVMGGANVIDQSLAAGLVDELRIHLSPLVLGDGTWLFDLVGPTTLVQREVIESPRAAHLTYEVVRDQAVRPGRRRASVQGWLRCFSYIRRAWPWASSRSKHRSVRVRSPGLTMHTQCIGA